MAGEMAQSTELLTHKPGDLSLDLQNTCRKLDTVVHDYNPSNGGMGDG